MGARPEIGPASFHLECAAYDWIGRWPLYGVMTYAVSQRTRELGIRISVGAGRGDVLKLILGQAVTLATIGMAGGLGASLAVTRFAANLLYGISPADPVTFTSIAVMLFAVVLLAGWCCRTGSATGR